MRGTAARADGISSNSKKSALRIKTQLLGETGVTKSRQFEQ